MDTYVLSLCSKPKSINTALIWYLWAQKGIFHFKVPKSRIMSFIDLFKSRKSRERLSHLRNLVAVAFADGKLEDNEMAALAIVMEREGLSSSDLERCINNPKDIKFIPPQTSEQRIAYLRDMVLLMMCDGDIDKREFALCKATAIALGFKHEIVDAIIMNIIADIKNQMNF